MTESSDGNKKKILIAEDEKPMARAMELKLTSSGFDITVVGNGEDALNALAKEKFDLLLLDLIMPRKDGFAVLTELKTKPNTMPIIVLSNLSQDDDIKRSKELGATEFFIKSNTPITELVTYVKRVLKLA